MRSLSVNDNQDFEKKTARASARLLARLQQHHDYSVPFQKIEIQEPEPVSVPVEVYVLPVNVGKITVETIKRAVCKQFGISHIQMLSCRRLQKIARARQVAMYLCKEYTSHSFPEIGRRLGGKDHTTVMHGASRIRDLIFKDWQLAYDVAHVEAQL